MLRPKILLQESENIAVMVIFLFDIYIFYYFIIFISLNFEYYIAYLTFVALSGSSKSVGKLLGAPRHRNTTAKVSRIVPVTPIEQQRYDNAEIRRQVRFTKTLKVCNSHLTHYMYNHLCSFFL